LLLEAAAVEAVITVAVVVLGVTDHQFQERVRAEARLLNLFFRFPQELPTR
jgi:hypothetical protein